MSVLNALKTSVLSAGFVTLLFAGSAEAISFSTADPNDTVADIEAEFGGSLDLLDGFTETTGNFDSFITFDAMAGDTVSFDFDFVSGESSLAAIYNDGGFYTLNDEAFLLADSSSAGAGSVSFTIDTDGEYTLGFGAFNATSLTVLPIPGFPLNTFDNAESILDIQNVTISDAQAVPEPASMIGLMAVAALGGSSVLKRKQS